MADAGPKSKLGIELKLTDGCNLNCFHCVNSDRLGRGSNLDSAIVTRGLREWWEDREGSRWRIEAVRMTGGEPLLNLPAVLDIAATCTCLGIRSGINTNATLLDKATAQALKGSGLTIVKVSFDAVDLDTLGCMRGRRASLEQTLESVRIAVDQGFQVLLRFTLCKHNVGHLVDCYRMARELRVARDFVAWLIAELRFPASHARITQPGSCRASQD